MKYFSLAIMLFALFLFSCTKSKVPDGILKPEKMQAVFWDYMRADVFTNIFIKIDSAKNAEIENARLQQQVFALHKITKDEFYKSYQYYLNHQELMKELMDTIVVRQQKVSESKKKAYGQKDSLLKKPVEL